MPSEKLVPYNLKLHRRGKTDPTYNLTELDKRDPVFDDGHIIDLMEEFLLDNIHENITDINREKTFVIEDFYREENMIEGIVSTGYYGYEAELRHAETGERTHTKSEHEAEQMPLYFLIYLPKTTTGEYYSNARQLLVILQQVNRIGVKTILSNRLEEFLLDSSSDSIMKFEPVYTSDVLEKILEADRITRLELKTREIPGDVERKHRILDGMDEEEVSSPAIVLRPERSGTLEWLKNSARNLKDSDTHFGELVSDDTENLRVTITKGNGRSETFSLLEEEVTMKKHLDAEYLEKENGLITADSLRNASNRLMKDIYDGELVETVRGDAKVTR